MLHYINNTFLNIKYYISLERLKAHLDEVLRSLLWVTLLWAGVGPCGPQRRLPTSVIQSCINSDLHCVHPITLGPLNVGVLFICGKASGHCILYIYGGGRAALFTFLWCLRYSNKQWLSLPCTGWREVHLIYVGLTLFY